jgi:ABC-type transport system involved in multi-copper enzyme maturation permease subunit
MRDGKKRMLPGPVFNVELLTTSRRIRYYVLRTLYGLLVLGAITLTYLETSAYRQFGMAGGEASINDLAWLANGFFGTFGFVQAFMVLAITPTLVAGAIVDEKQRKTLGYLLTSPLSSSEIVLGKLLARILHLAVFLGVGLPILSLLTLFGGIDPKIIGLVYAATLSTAFFLASLSIFVSTIARRVRDAIALVYMMELGWLTLPLILDQVVRFNWPAAYPAIAKVNDWFLYSAPSAVYFLAAMRGSVVSATFWMIGLQLAFGFALVGLSVWRLRPIYAAQGEGSAKPAGLRSRLRNWGWRILPRRPCGDDPMIWKELQVSRTSGLVRLISLVLAISFGALLAWALAYTGQEALGELDTYGYSFTNHQEYRARAELNALIRSCGTVIYVLVLLGVAANAATSVTSEREADSWTSLISSPLSGLEILRAKMMGAIWSMRGLWFGLLCVWLVGLLLGALHPLGLIFSSIELAVFLAFAAALGVSISMRAKSSLRAQVATIATLVFINGGYLLCCIPLEPDTFVIAAGSTPFIMAVCPLSYSDVAEFWNGLQRTSNQSAIACVAGFVIYSLAAFALAATAFESFDRVMDRPSRERQDLQPMAGRKDQSIFMGELE